MSTSLSGSFTWGTPSVYNSGDTFMAADYDTLVKDVALLYAKPYGIVSATTSVSSVISGTVLFGTASNPTLKVNNPVSGAGTVGFSSQALSAPIDGLYRVTVNLQVVGVNAAHYQVIAKGQGGLSANNFTYTSPSITGNSSLPGGAFLSFITPMSASGTTAYATSVYFQTATSVTVTVNGGTPPIYNTWASLEYLGSFGNI